MNRISRRTAAETAEALLEVGRTQPVLQYDVELGLERHHQWLRNEAPVPEWAVSAGAGTAAKAWLPVVIKTIVSAMLMGTIGAAAWQLRSRPQPSDAAVKAAAPAAPLAAPSVDVTASEAWMAQTPMPVTEHGQPSELPVRRSARADVSDKRTSRLRPHKERAASLHAEPIASRAQPIDPAPSRAEPTAPTALATPGASESASAEPAPRREAAPKPTSADQKQRPAPAPRPQAPDDLAEMQQVAKAEQLLPRSPARALALVHQGDQQFARGYFQQERAYIAIMSLIRLGRIEEARSRAASFAKQFPPLPYGARIRKALEAHESKPAP